MAYSATQQKILELGKQLVTLLNGDGHDEDILTDWMAHHIAEQLTTLENQSLKENETRDRCLDTILKVWQHRAFLRNGHRPFEKFEPIFRILEQLDPEEPRPYYHFFRETGEPQKPQTVELMVKLIENVDHAARTVIELALVLAIESATTEQTRSLLENAAPGGSSYELEIIERLLIMKQRFAQSDQTDSPRAIERMRERIRSLDNFANVCQVARKTIVRNLKALEKAVKQKT